MRDRPGLLFSRDALPQQVGHGAAVELGGSQWEACVEIDCLILKTGSQTDDKKEQTASRIANIMREVEAREQELEALAGDIAKVTEEAETVTLLLSLLFPSFCNYKIVLLLLMLLRATTPTASARSFLASVRQGATTRSESPS